MVNLANRLTELRKNAGLTQLQLSVRINYSDKVISKWERGESVPDLHAMMQLAKIYGVTLDELVNGTSAPVLAQTPPPSVAGGQGNLSVPPAGGQQVSPNAYANVLPVSTYANPSPYSSAAFPAPSVQPSAPPKPNRRKAKITIISSVSTCVFALLLILGVGLGVIMPRIIYREHLDEVVRNWYAKEGYAVSEITKGKGSATIVATKGLSLATLTIYYNTARAEAAVAAAEEADTLQLTSTAIEYNLVCISSDFEGVRIFKNAHHSSYYELEQLMNSYEFRNYNIAAVSVHGDKFKFTASNGTSVAEVRCFLTASEAKAQAERYGKMGAEKIAVSDTFFCTASDFASLHVFMDNFEMINAVTPYNLESENTGKEIAAVRSALTEAGFDCSNVQSDLEYESMYVTKGNCSINIYRNKAVEKAFENTRWIDDTTTSSAFRKGEYEFHIYDSKQGIGSADASAALAAIESLFPASVSFGISRMELSVSGLSETVDLATATDEELDSYEDIIALYGGAVRLAANQLTFTGTLTSLFNPASFTLSGNSVTFTNPGLSAVYSAQLNGDTFKLIFAQNGIGYTVEYSASRIGW